MALALTPELEKFIQNQVANGKYASAEEVLIAGLKLLEEREHLYQERFEELKREVMVGVEEADRGELIDGETVFHNLREKLAQRRRQTGQ
ncbi:MAG: type II toxin-antitoxin system ParD family antitoxin [Gloeobacterales cyanobacterium]